MSDKICLECSWFKGTCEDLPDKEVYNKYIPGGLARGCVIKCTCMHSACFEQYTSPIHGRGTRGNRIANCTDLNADLDCKHFEQIVVQAPPDPVLRPSQCPICRCSMRKKYYLFGDLVCDNTDCSQSN